MNITTCRFVSQTRCAVSLRQQTGPELAMLVLSMRQLPGRCRHARGRALAVSDPAVLRRKVENFAENLGEVLRGDRIESSLYELQMKHDEYCKVLCPPQGYTKYVASHA